MSPIPLKSLNDVPLLFQQRLKSLAWPTRSCPLCPPHSLPSSLTGFQWLMFLAFSLTSTPVHLLVSLPQVSLHILPPQCAYTHTLRRTYAPCTWLMQGCLLILQTPGQSSFPQENFPRPLPLQKYQSSLFQIISWYLVLQKFRISHLSVYDHLTHSVTSTGLEGWFLPPNMVPPYNTVSQEASSTVLQGVYMLSSSSRLNHLYSLFPPTALSLYFHQSHSADCVLFCGLHIRSHRLATGWPPASRNYTMFINTLLKIQYGSLVIPGFLEAYFEGLPYNSCEEAFRGLYGQRGWQSC